VRSARIVGDGHLKIEIELPGSKASLPGFGFQLGHVMPKTGDRVDITGSLRPDTWRGNGAVELRVQSIAPEGGVPVVSD
jgi:hypothetical protein